MTLPFQSLNLYGSVGIQSYLDNTIKCGEITYIVDGEGFGPRTHESRNPWFFYTKSMVKITNYKKVCPQ